MVKKVSSKLALLLIVSLVLTCIAPAVTVIAYSDIVEEYTEGVSCYKQSTVKIKGSKTIYFDPFAMESSPKDGDIVFITHTHGDHYSAAEIKKVLKKSGTLVITADGVAQAKKDGFSKVLSVTPGKKYTVRGITFTTVAAYNTNKDFHKKESLWVGYNVTMNDKNYYMAGDTDMTAEMKKVKTDVAFLPVGGTYTMDAKEAAEAANTIKPKVAIPIHFGDVVGTTGDAREFVALLDKKVEGVVLKNLLNGVSHMKQSTVKIVAGKTVYFDPINITGEPKDADYVFITHTHGDHFSPQDIKKVIKDTTKIIIPADGVETSVTEGFRNILTVEPMESYTINGMSFQTVPAYNLNKDFHKKDMNWVGYILNINNTTYYFAGDTDFIPEMMDIKADVVFLPVGGTYTMTAAEAAEAAIAMKPLVAVPIHFADIVGTMEDAEIFVELLDDTNIKGMIIKE